MYWPPDIGPPTAMRRRPAFERGNLRHVRRRPPPLRKARRHDGRCPRSINGSDSTCAWFPSRPHRISWVSGSLNCSQIERAQGIAQVNAPETKPVA